jgi:hypothetical protein
VADIAALVRFQTDAWITAKLESLADEILAGVQYTSFSEAGKSHSQQPTIPIEDVMTAVTAVAYERGLNAANNIRKARTTFVRFS